MRGPYGEDAAAQRRSEHGPEQAEAALTLNIGGICRAGMPSTGCDLGCSSGSYAWRWDVSDLGYRTPVGALVVTGADISCFGGTYLLEGDWRP